MKKMIKKKPESMRRVRKGRPKIIGNKADEVIRLYNADFSIREIAKTSNVSVHTVYRILRDSEEEYEKE